MSVRHYILPLKKKYVKKSRFVKQHKLNRTFKNKKMNTKQKYSLWFIILFLLGFVFPVLAQKPQESVAKEVVYNFYNAINQDADVNDLLKKYIASESVLAYDHLNKTKDSKLSISDYLKTAIADSYEKKVDDPLNVKKLKHTRLLWRVDIAVKIGENRGKDTVGVLVEFKDASSPEGKIFHIDEIAFLDELPPNFDVLLLEKKKEELRKAATETLIEESVEKIAKLKELENNSELVERQREIDNEIQQLSTDRFARYLNTKGTKGDTLKQDIIALQEKIDKYYRTNVFKKSNSYHFRRGSTNKNKHLFTEKFSSQEGAFLDMGVYEKEIKEGKPFFEINAKTSDGIDPPTPVKLTDKKFFIPGNVKIGKYQFKLKVDGHDGYLSNVVHIRHKYPLILKIGIAIPFAVWGIYDFYHHSTFQEPDLPMPPDPNDK